MLHLHNTDPFVRAQVQDEQAQGPFPCLATSTDAATATAADALGLYLSEIGATPLLSPEEEHLLALRVQAGDEVAREQFLTANLRLVVHVAQRYQRDERDLPDLIQDGNLGLLRALESFDPAYGTKFSTYAYWWISQAIRRGREQTARLVRLPSYLDGRLGRIARARARLFEQHGCEPSTEQIAAALGLSVAEVEQAQAADRQMLSLDRPVSAHEEATLGDFIADGSLPPADEALCHEEAVQAQRHEIASLLACLTERERAVIMLRFGLDERETGGTRSMAEVGRVLGISRERVRQLQHRAMSKIRAHAQQSVPGARPPTQPRRTNVHPNTAEQKGTHQCMTFPHGK
ncbi:MAG TPA: sigma-70 family RNA polymerase sigma factor [Ktedonobacteraceae bacterium]|nr:sigma-70 family RNA polymerase sigma factor [Ktedonobacteraceae bacterium]